MAGLEHFEFGRDAGLADFHRHGFEMGRRVDEYLAAHVHAAHVEAADFRLELDHVAHARGRQRQRAAGRGFQRLVGAGDKARAGAGGEIDQRVGAACADALHHLAVERSVHARLRRLRVAHVDVDDGRARLGGVDRGGGDLGRRHRDGRIAARRIRRAGHRASDHHLTLHSPTALPVTRCADAHRARPCPISRSRS